MIAVNKAITLETPAKGQPDDSEPVRQHVLKAQVLARAANMCVT